MGLLDSLGLGDMLKSLLGQARMGGLSTMINNVLAQTQYRDLNGLVAALEKGGLGAQVQSWLGPGANQPITAEQLKAIIGNSQVRFRRASSACRSTKRSRPWRSTCRTSSTRRRRTERSSRPEITRRADFADIDNPGGRK